MRALLLVPALLALELLSLPAAADDAALTLDEAVRLASRAQPMLDAQAARVRAAGEQSASAGALPDPQLVAGFSNVPVDDPDPFASDAEPMTMTSIGLMQEFPNRARRDALNRRQAHVAAAATAEQALLVRSVQRDVALAWVDVWQPAQALGLVAALAEQTRQLRDATEIAYRSARAEQSELHRAAVALALVDDRRLQFEQDLDSARARLARWIDTDAQRRPAAVLPPAPALPALEVALATLDDHPELKASAQAAEVAQAGLALAHSSYRPDWRVQAMYGYRRPYGDMVSLQVGFDLPLFPANRQDRAVASARAEQDAADADTEDRRRALRAALEAAWRDESKLTQRLDQYDATLLPSADARSAAALAAYEAGRGSLDEVLTARREALDLRLMRLVLEAERQRQRIALTYLLSGA